MWFMLTPTGPWAIGHVTQNSLTDNWCCKMFHHLNKIPRRCNQNEGFFVQERCELSRLRLNFVLIWKSIDFNEYTLILAFKDGQLRDFAGFIYLNIYISKKLFFILILLHIIRILSC